MIASHHVCVEYFGCPCFDHPVVAVDQNRVFNFCVGSQILGELYATLTVGLLDIAATYQIPGEEPTLTIRTQPIVV